MRRGTVKVVLERAKLAIVAAVFAGMPLFSAPANATVTTHVAGWRIDQESTGCSMAKSDANRGSLRIAFGLDEDGDADTKVDRINIHLGDERYAAKVPVDLVHTIAGQQFTLRAHPNMNSPFSGRFASLISPANAALLATAPNAIFGSVGGDYLFGVSLEGYAEALTALTVCTKRVETEFWRGRE